MRLGAAALLAAAVGIASGAGQPAPYVTGRVIDAVTGEALAGATIHIAGRRDITLKTDAEGRYQSSTLLPGMYAFTVTREKYLPAMHLYAGRVPLRLRVRDDGIGPAIVQKDWMLEREAIIRGRVLNADDSPVEGALVIAARRLRNVDGWPQFEPASSARTLPDGRFEIAHLASGPYVLMWRHGTGGGAERWFYSPGIVDPRHAAQVEAIAMGAGEPVTLRASSAPFPALRVSVQGPGGLPAADTAIEIEVWQPLATISRLETIAGVTDNSGRATLQDVPVGRHRLRARSPSRIDARTHARADTVLEVPAQLAGAEVRLANTVDACLLTRFETDGIASEDIATRPFVSASTRDGALSTERLESRAPLGELIRLAGLLPGSRLRVGSYAEGPPWLLTRFAPPVDAEPGVVPIDASAAGCTAVYFRRASQFIKGRVVLGDFEWVPDVALIATPVGSPAAPTAVAAMTDDGSFYIGGIALGMQYDVIAVPAGIDPKVVPTDLRHVMKVNGGETITIPLSLPIAR